MSRMLENIIEALRVINSTGKYPSNSGTTMYSDLGNLAALDRFREEYFGDEQSREVFDWACKYHIVATALGHGYYSIPGAPITLEQWKELEQRASAMTEGFAEGDYLIDRIDTWLLESYRLPGLCEVKPGDVVLDCGAHVGNTSMYFSQKTGDAGRVFAFEPMPNEFKLLQKNVGHLPNVSPINAAVLDAKGLTQFSVMGVASRQASEARGHPVVPVYTLSIDEFVTARHLEKVDFIKMDIEGGEAAALKGAKETITRCKPKMAISVYHKTQDLVELPALIHDILPDYSFSLRQFMHINWETVLFCYHT